MRCIKIMELKHTWTVLKLLRVESLNFVELAIAKIYYYFKQKLRPQHVTNLEEMLFKRVKKKQSSYGMTE